MHDCEYTTPVFGIGVEFSSLGNDVVKQADRFVNSTTRLPPFFCLCFFFAVTIFAARESSVLGGVRFHTVVGYCSSRRGTRARAWQERTAVDLLRDAEK